jgi:hypothetical protein
MLMLPSVVFAELSALSVAAPPALWFAPSPARTASLAHSCTPERASPQVKRTRTALLNQPAAFAGRDVPSSLTVAALIVGAVRSILTPLTDVEAELPALSEMVAGPAPRFEPSPLRVLSAGWVAESIPDSRSWPVQWIVTSPLYQPKALGFVVAAPESVGGVRSMLMSFTVAVALLPALSSAWPVTLWPAPSLVSVVGSSQPAIPDSASEQLKVTVTGPLFHPKAFPTGDRLPSIVGGTPSIFRVSSWPGAVLSSVLPALSTLQKVIVWIPFGVCWNGPA